MTPSGRPAHAKCHGCGKGRTRLRITGRSYQLTGKVPAWSTVREYACLQCGHVGWSAHPELRSVEPMTVADERARLDALRSNE